MIRSHRLRIGTCAGGFSYVEVLIATAFVIFALTAALDALQSGAIGVGQQQAEGDTRFALKAKLESVLAEPFTQLETAANVAAGPANPTTYSDPVGTPRRRLVFLSLYDGDNADLDDDPFTGVDPGLLWISVAIEGGSQSLQTLKYDPI